MENNWKNKRQNVMHGVYRNKFYRLLNNSGVKFGLKELNQYTYYDFSFLVELLCDTDFKKYGNDTVHSNMVHLMDEEDFDDLYKEIVDSLGINQVYQLYECVDQVTIAGAYILDAREDALMYSVVKLWWKYFKSYQHRWGMAYVDIGQERKVEQNVENIEDALPAKVALTIGYMWD